MDYHCYWGSWHWVGGPHSGSCTPLWYAPWRGHASSSIWYHCWCKHAMGKLRRNLGVVDCCQHIHCYCSSWDVGCRLTASFFLLLLRRLSPPWFCCWYLVLLHMCPGMEALSIMACCIIVFCSWSCCLVASCCWVWVTAAATLLSYLASQASGWLALCCLRTCLPQACLQRWWFCAWCRSFRPTS